MTPRFDWWQVQAIHPHKTEPFDIYISRFPTETRAREVMDDLMRQGYQHITIVPPTNLKG